MPFRSNSGNRAPPPPPALSMTKLEPGQHAAGISPTSQKPGPNAARGPDAANPPPLITGDLDPASVFGGSTFMSPLDAGDSPDRPPGQPRPAGFEFADDWSIASHGSGLEGDQLNGAGNGNGTDEGIAPDASPQTNFGLGGAVLGGVGFDDLNFDDNSMMADILDPSAAAAASSSAPGKGPGANIAPWLQEDTPVSPVQTRQVRSTSSPAPTMPVVSVPSANASSTTLDRKRGSTINHFPSVPSLPRLLHRHHNDEYNNNNNNNNNNPYPLQSSTGSGSSSASSLVPPDAGTATPSSGRARSIRGLRRDPSPPRPTERHMSIASTGSTGSTHSGGHRMRFGSMAPTSSTRDSISSTSGGQKKGGFLGNLLKRRTGQSVSAGSGVGNQDFLASGNRTAGRASVATQGSRLRESVSSADGGGTSPTAPRATRSFSHKSAQGGDVSPLHEESEEDKIDDPNLHEFHLNTDLDDMEGIVDTNLANAQPAAPPPPTDGDAGGAGLTGGLNHTSISTTDESISGGSDGQRRVVQEADGSGTFTRPNPFSGSSAGSDQIRAQMNMGTPPSPFTMTSIGPGAAPPRRPSQLRNMKVGSVDSNNSDVSALQPLNSSWPSVSGSTMFKDPFAQGAQQPTINEGQPVSPSQATGRPSEQGGAQPGIAPAIAPAIAPYTAGAAWAAPESWSVEVDEEDDGGDSSSSESEGWGERDPGATSLPKDTSMTDGTLTPGRAGSRGHHHHHHHHKRVGALTGKSDEGPMHFTRIYRADGSYSTMSFPLHTTTAELIAILAGDAGKAAASMKLYVRERGQDRQLLPSERPLVLQSRRLQQAGYTEAEHIEELGKEDFSMLYRFIYQTPVLPVINPEEESSYESFEFIDLSGRDLQIIPIFLHLHADNIIILNVSRNPMTDLPLDFIQACTSLKELRMSNMALKRVPASIRASTTLSRLDISCNRIADLESAGLNEISTLLSLKVQNNRLSSVPSYFVQMKALKYLNISNNVFETFPSVVCEMSNLVDLDVSFNQIAELPPEMVDLRSLERLICVGNELKEFPKSFSSMANLRVLDVRRNKLVDLTPVNLLPNLATLRADSNNLVTLDTQLGAKVREFSVPHNSITRFTLGSMEGQTYSLTHLNLSHAKLSGLDDSAFSELVNLVDLNLSFNQFSRLPQTLDRLINLEHFSCTDNMLASIPPGCLGNMQKLRLLNLHNNNLKDLPSDVWLCGSIEIINLSSNLLELLPAPPATWFESVEPAASRKMSTVSHGSTVSQVEGDQSRLVPPAGFSLRRLFLADNRLTDDLFHQIALFSSLKVLNLSFNDIYEIPSYTLSRCDKLEALYLSGNKLTSLPAEDLERLPNLKVLHVNGNKLQTLPSEIGSIKHLEHLDVGSNILKYNISNWPYDWNWNWNTALRYLNLSGNKRLEIKPSSGQDASHTHTGPGGAVRRDLSDFSALTHLRVLGLMDVTLRISSLPDESDDKRVRTSFSDINNMAYGISDMLGTVDHLAMFDLAVPNFRGSPQECLFGMFGRAAPSFPSGKIPKFVQEHFATTLAEMLKCMQPGDATTEALRRTFLYINRSTFESLSGIESRNQSGDGAYMMMNTRRTSPTLNPQLRTGASGAVVYVVDKTLHVANAGDTLVVISRKGEAELMSKRHDPTDREETARIRRAEAWVSPKGLVNDDKEIEISRAFGFYHALPAVNASPEVRTRVLSESDEFVIIGNSALWKCCSYQTAVDIARTERDDPMMAAQKLRDFAISYGAEGSVMVMIVNVSNLFGRGRAGANVAPESFDGDYLKRARQRRVEEVGDRTLNRLQQEIEPPSGQVALVFTDIVNSTVLWETNPGMPTAIKMHHNLFRRQLRLDGGYEVKTEGDAFMVSFASVTAALVWAFNCQIGLLQLDWPRELLESEDGKVIYDSKGTIIHRGLRVRMGIHWGAPECEKDPITRRMDYYGPMVNRSARIQSSADGGQLMASQDVLNVIRELREYIESSDEHTLDDLPQDVKRDMQELRRIGGIEIKDMGERKLKGLEVPEKLSLLFPKTLSGRLELFSGLRANVEVNEQRTYASERAIEEARALSLIGLRLEALCTMSPMPAAGDRSGALNSPVHPSFPMHQDRAPERLGVATARKSIVALYSKPAPPNPTLGPTIRDNMTEDELLEVLASLTTRIENCLSTLYLKHLGGFSTVLGALEQATRIDPQLLIHALSLMGGVMASPR